MGVMTRIFGTPFAAVYPLYVAKLEKKNRTRAELDQAIEWLTGFDEPTLKRLIDEGATSEQFFAAAHLNPNTTPSSPVSCARRGDRDPLMQKIRYLDKLVDELAKGKAIEKVLRAP